MATRSTSGFSWGPPWSTGIWRPRFIGRSTWDSLTPPPVPCPTPTPWGESACPAKPGTGTTTCPSAPRRTYFPSGTTSGSPPRIGSTTLRPSPPWTGSTWCSPIRTDSPSIIRASSPLTGQVKAWVDGKWRPSLPFRTGSFVPPTQGSPWCGCGTRTHLTGWLAGCASTRRMGSLGRRAWPWPWAKGWFTWPPTKPWPSSPQGTPRSPILGLGFRFQKGSGRGPWRPPKESCTWADRKGFTCGRARIG